MFIYPEAIFFDISCPFLYTLHVNVLLVGLLHSDAPEILLKYNKFVILDDSIIYPHNQPNPNPKANATGNSAI